MGLQACKRVHSSVWLIVISTICCNAFDKKQFLGKSHANSFIYGTYMIAFSPARVRLPHTSVGDNSLVLVTTAFAQCLPCTCLSMLESDEGQAAGPVSGLPAQSCVRTTRHWSA